ncbi:MAG TPA: hypothetical protein DIU00_09980 [Phycisphaerales bacterium]|nr:hypothetical protein [Phycisphaerales bacterium]
MFSQSRRILIGCTVAIVLAGSFQAAFADTEANKAIMLRAEEFWNGGDMAIMKEVYADDMVNHDPTTPDVRDYDSLKGFAAALFAGMPDFHVTSQDMVAEGDKVAGRWTATATQTGELFGIPPSGKQATWTGISVYRLADGKVAEVWWSKDVLGMMEQIGVMPPTRVSYIWGEPSGVTGDPGDPETNKAIVQRMIDEVMNNQNMAVIDELFATDYVMHDPAWPMEIKGPDGFKQWAGAMLEPFFSNSNITGEMTAEGDKVAVYWSWSGTHTGEFMGIPPTGNQIAITGTSIHRFADGKFVESWASYDMMGFMQQLSAPPKWPIAGAWINLVPIPDLGVIIGELTVVPQDSEGLQFTSVVRSGKPDPTVFGVFPDADHQSDHIGPIVWTGSPAYESTLIGYGTKMSEVPGMLPEIVYISILTAKTQFVDRNSVKGEGTHAFFLASQDVDSDGLPDEGQEPVACFPYISTAKRVQLMPPCVPPPPEPEGE